MQIAEIVLLVLATSPRNLSGGTAARRKAPGVANCLYQGKVIGAFEDGQTAHDVAGEVFAVDDVTIRLIGFTYDGNGPGKSVSRLKWISIWCRAFAADFGHVDIPANFNPPAEHDLGEMGPGPSSYGVFAESVVIVNVKQIRFVNLDYIGNGPGV
ncbi:protein Skeletor, isoforms B/C-like [Diadema setosum]|uniref:protein Skeletor, isoforms B/C-like n=1 Tax=Diadema setosum TaxID=31175 RepID=UPI003B3A2FD6